MNMKKINLLILIFLILGVMTGCGDSLSTAEKNAEAERRIAEENAKAERRLAEENAEAERRLAEENAEAEKIKVLSAEAIDVYYMDLYNNSDEYYGKLVRINGKVYSSLISKNQILINENMSKATDRIRITLIYPKLSEYNNYENKYVTVIGTAAGIRWGELIIDDAYVEYSGTQSEENYKAQKVEEIPKIPVERMDDYKSSCVEVDFKTFGRTKSYVSPNQFKITGEIVRYWNDEEEKKVLLYIVNMTKSEDGTYKDTIIVERRPILGSNDKLLEGDIVTFYGSRSSDKSYTINGENRTAPCLYMEYCDIIE